MVDGKVLTSVALMDWHGGERESLEQILQRHLPWINSKVRQRMSPLLRKKAETADFVQDALVNFLDHAPNFVLASEEDFKALLLTIAQNVMHNKYNWFTAKRRAVARERPIPADTVLCLDPQNDGPSTPSASADKHERQAWVRFGMEFLNPDYREILVLRQWDGLSFSEIGTRLGISSDAAWMKHRRAVDKLAHAVFLLRAGKLRQILSNDLA